MEHRRYVETEIQARSIESPFRIDGAIVGLFTVLAALRQEGRDIARMLRAVEMMAQANSRRVSVAAALLPPLHWVTFPAENAPKNHIFLFSSIQLS